MTLCKCACVKPFQSPLGAYGHNTPSLLTTVASGAGLNKLGNYYTIPPFWSSAIDRLYTVFISDIYTEKHGTYVNVPMWNSIPYSEDCISFHLYIVCSDTVYGHKGCISPFFVAHFLKLLKNGCLDIVALNEMMFWVVHYHVLTCPKACSIQVYWPPSSSSPPLPVASSFICYILLTAMEKKGCSTYIKRQSSREACRSVGVHVSFVL